MRFQGLDILSDQLPRTYAPIILGITLPEFYFLIAALAPFVLVWRLRRRTTEPIDRRLAVFIALIVVATFFPIASAIQSRTILYDGIPLMVDLNCPLNGEAAIAFAHSCRDAAPMFLEEPVWPPEDFATLAEVRAKGGLNVAAGENACTVHQFREMMKAGAVSHAQPSVIKVGGITEYLRVVALADELGVRLAPHSPYFGPGLLATLQLMSLRDDASFVEVFYMKRAACLWRGCIDVDANGDVEVPQGPGLGYEPDTAVMEQYRIS